MELCLNDEDVWKIIDKKVASPMDARDNGFDITTSKFEEVIPYRGAQTFLIFSPTWQENDTNLDEYLKNK